MWDISWASGNLATRQILSASSLFQHISEFANLQIQFDFSILLFNHRSNPTSTGAWKGNSSWRFSSSNIRIMSTSNIEFWIQLHTMIEWVSELSDIWRNFITVSLINISNDFTTFHVPFSLIRCLSCKMRGAVSRDYFLIVNFAWRCKREPSTASSRWRLG